MNKRVFILGSFLTTSFTVATSLQLVSCNVKQKLEVKENVNEKTAEQIEIEKATKLKAEIKSTIDEILINPNNNDWIINFVDDFSEVFNNIVDCLNKTIEDIKTQGKNKIDLDQILDLDEDLVYAVKQKFASINKKVVEQINKRKEALGISKFVFNLDLASIFPKLTVFTGKQMLDAVKKIKGLKPSTNNVKYSAILNGLTTNHITHLDLFKITTDLQYNFSFGGETHADFYNECELFLTEDAENYAKLNHIVQEVVANMISEDEDMKNIQIYNEKKDSEEFTKLQNFEYVGKNMDWDFSKQTVKEEIKTMQYDNMKSSRRLNSIIDDLEFDVENFEFEPLNYMKFDNYQLPLKQDAEDCVLVCKKTLIKKADVIKSIDKQYGLGENSSMKTFWDGSKINTKFIDQLKKDGATDKPIIDYSKFYGLGEFKDLYSDFLVGYGTTTIRKVYFTDVPLSKINITTALTVPYGAGGIVDLYNGFKNYVGTILDAVWNEQAEGTGKSKGIELVVDNNPANVTPAEEYFIQWKFDNPGEWEAIEEKLSNNNNEIMFDWIMEDILLKKRILAENSKYVFSTDVKDFITKTALKSEREIKYVKHATKKGLVEKDKTVKDVNNKAKISLKYGPFVIFLTGEDSMSFWSADDLAISSE